MSCRFNHCHNPTDAYMGSEEGGQDGKSEAEPSWLSFPSMTPAVWMGLRRELWAVGAAQGQKHGNIGYEASRYELKRPLGQESDERPHGFQCRS